MDNDLKVPTANAPAHAIVTGGSAGIGLAVASMLAAGGYLVTIIGRDETRLSAACNAIEAQGGRVATVRGDVIEIEKIGAVVREARERFGPVSILVNNAGDAASVSIADASPEHVRRVLDLNVTQVFEFIRQCLPDMTSGGFGRVVSIASTAAVKGYPFTSAYCAAKHAVIGMTRSLALELVRTGVTVNAVCPGYTETDLVQRQLTELSSKTGRSRDQLYDRLRATNPMGRMVHPEEVSAAVMFLVSTASASITGQALVVAGGEHMAG